MRVEIDIQRAEAIQPIQEWIESSMKNSEKVHMPS